MEPITVEDIDEQLRQLPSDQLALVARFIASLAQRPSGGHGSSRSGIEEATSMDLANLRPAVRAFLDEPRYAVVATINASGVPQLTPLWYELQGDEVLMNTVAGRLKDRNLRRDPRLTLCVEDGERYVTLYGRAALIDDQGQAHADDVHLAIRYEGAERGAGRGAFIAGQQRVSIRMAITHVHARGFDA